MTIGGLSFSSAGTDGIILHLAQNQSRLRQDSAELSSGLRITQPADDPSGYTTAQGIKTYVSSLDTSSQSIENANAVLNTVTGDQQSILALLQRVNTLAVSASTSLVSSTELGQIQTEINQITAEINNISQQIQTLTGVITPPASAVATPTELQYQDHGYGANPSGLNTVTLNPGAPIPGDRLIVQIRYLYQPGASAPPVITAPPGWTILSSGNDGSHFGYFIYTKVAQAGDSSFVWNLANVANCGGDYTEYTPSTVTAIAQITQADATLPLAGTLTTNTIPIPSSTDAEVLAGEYSGANLGNLGLSSSSQPLINFGPYYGRLYAGGSVGHVTTDQETLNYSSAVQADFAAAQLLVLEPQIPQSQAESVASDAAEGATNQFAISKVSAYALGESNISVTTSAGAFLAQVLSKAAIDQLTTLLGQEGASQIVLTNTVSNEQLESVNLTAAQSNIQDANIASVSTNFVREQIIENFGTALLAQANVRSSLVNQLFR